MQPPNRPNTRTAKDVLKRALNLLGPEGENWAKREYAYNTNNEGTHAEDPDAQAFCALGAIDAAVSRMGINPENQRTLRYRAKDFLSKVINQDNPEQRLTVPHWNDRPLTLFPTIRQAFERAIELAN